MINGNALLHEINEGEKLFFRLIAAGGERSFTTLFQQHKQMVYTVALAYTRNETQTDDIVQDVFVQI